MRDLTPEDEALLSRAREGIAARGDDHARNKRRLFAQIAAGTVAATTAATTTASTSAAATTALAGASVATAGGAAFIVKLVAVVAVAGAALAGSLVLATGASTHRSTEVVPTVESATPRAKPTPAGPLAAQAPVVAPRPPVVLPVAPSASAVARDPVRVEPPPPARSWSASAVVAEPHPSVESLASPPSPPLPPPPVGPSSLAAETYLLRRAGSALRDGDASLALSLLEQHEATFPAGVLVEERQAERVVVLCELGRVSEARAAAATFLSRWPQSPEVARVRGSCGGR